jgi:TonB-linked SusC/RagA family outer membrane protein
MKSKTFMSIINVLRKNRTYIKGCISSFPLMSTSILLCLFFSLLPQTMAQAQTSKLVTGVIKDVNGQAIPGVSVVAKGTYKGTITDQNGSYSLSVPTNVTTLVFRFVGMKTLEFELTNSNTQDVVMTDESVNLNEVVVVGYGTQKKETSTGAISTIKTTEILRTPVANVGNAMVGLVAGISSVQFGGEPGSSDATIRIRGVSTLNGTGQDALVVIDGLQQDMGALNSMDPYEIENISVLKDASATAIYGIRGANGVIIVTTKRGDTGKPKISFTSNTGFTQSNSLFKPVNSYDYAIFRNEAVNNEGVKRNLLFSDNELWKFQNNRDYTDAELSAMNLTPDQLAAAKASPALYYGSHDYFKEQYGGVAPQSQINLNVSGGDKNVDYFTSVGYFKQDGIINYDYYNTDVNSHYDRYNFRSNVDIKSIKNLTISLNLSSKFTETTGMGVNGQDNANRYWSINQFIMEATPFKGPGIRDGKLINGYISTLSPMTKEKGAEGNAPINNIFGGNSGTKSISNIVSSLNLKYNLDFITKGLSVATVTSYDDTYQKGSTISTPVPRYTAARNPKNPAEILYFGGTVDPVTIDDNVSNYKTRKYYVEARISYVQSFGNHNVSGVLIGNGQKLLKPDLLYNVPEGLMGTAARTTYNFKEKYLAEFNMAYNGSENFPEGNRFGFFPSFSAGWVVSKENFFQNIKFISWLKIRGSYGVVGNDKIGGSRFLYLPNSWSNYGTSANILEGYFFGTTNGSSANPYYLGSYENKLGNPVVTWEKAEKRNISLETRYFEDQLSVTLDLFNENRTNILANLGVVPELTGANFPAANVGEVFNQGYEVEVNWRSHIGEFGYFIKGFAAYAKNKIINQDEALYDYKWMNATGYSIGQFKGYKNDGFFNTKEEVNNRPSISIDGNKVQPGDIRYIDINGDGLIDAKDRIPIGFSNLPLYSFSSTVGFSYKGFDFSALFTGSKDGSFVYNSENLSTPFFKDNGIAFQWQYDGRWTPEKVANGITPTFPRAGLDANTKNNAASLSDFWLKPNDFIKLKNIEIGYSFQSIANRLNLRKIRFSLTANNVWLIKTQLLDGLDPEQLDAGSAQRGFIYPMTSAYTASLNVEF